MKTWKFYLLMAIVVILGLSFHLACGDDDDDDTSGGDDDDESECAEGCSIIYDDCGERISAEVDEAECVTLCDSDGALRTCHTDCLDAWGGVEDCDALKICVLDCGV